MDKDKKMVLTISTMTDAKTKRKALKVAADIIGVDSIAADMKGQTLTVIGQMDTTKMVNKLQKVGKVEIVLVVPAKEEEKGRKEGREERRKEDKKEEKKEEKKGEKKEEKKGEKRGDDKQKEKK